MRNIPTPYYSELVSTSWQLLVVNGLKLIYSEKSHLLKSFIGMFFYIDKIMYLRLT